MKKHSAAIVIEDGTFTFDTRVQRQARALRDVGLNAIVVCPAGEGERSGRTDEDGVIVYRYPAYEAQGFKIWQRLIEHSIKLILPFFIIFYLRLFKRVRCFQFCNPTDFSALLGRLISFTGAKYIYDQHDLVPEIYMVDRDTEGSGMLKILLAFEARAYRWSDHVIVVNDSFKEVAATRGDVSDDKISIVRNGPNDAIFDYLPDPSAVARPADDMRRIGYVGNVNAQDGLDLLVDIAAEAKKGAIPFIYEIIGDGGGLQAIRTLVEERDVSEYFSFHGRKRWGGGIEEILARCDFCVQPDPYSELNEKCSMTKSLEYLARGKTFVSYPLKETLHSCADFAYFADDFSKEAFVRKFLEVLETHQEEEGAFDQRQRYIREKFSWMISEREYVHAYLKVLDVEET